MIKKTQKIMLTLSPTSATPWLFFKVRIAEGLNYFSSFFNIETNIFSGIIIKENNYMIESLNKKREQALTLTPDVAKNKLKKFKRDLSTYENLKKYTSESSNIDLKNSFRLLVKASYRYEARLHTVAYSDVSVIETPEYIKQGLAELGKRSLSNIQSTNAFL